MFRDRVYMILGSSLAMVSSVVLLFTAHRLADTFAVGADPAMADGLATTLTLIVWTACGVGLGLCLTSYGFSIAAGHRALTTYAKWAFVLGGIVFTLSGILMLIAFRDLQTDMDAIRAASALQTNTVTSIAKTASQRILSTFMAFVSAEMLTLIAVSSLLLGKARETPVRPLRVSLLSGLLATVIGFTFALLLATKFGAGAVTLTGTVSPESLASLDSSLRWEVRLMVFSACSLIAFGVLRIVQAVLFPVKDEA